MELLTERLRLREYVAADVDVTHAWRRDPRYLEHYPLSETAVLVVSDHGFKWTEGRPRGLSGTAGPTAPHNKTGEA